MQHFTEFLICTFSVVVHLSGQGVMYILFKNRHYIFKIYIYNWKTHNSVVCNLINFYNKMTNNSLIFH